MVKTNCKDYYWHLINNSTYMPKAITVWENINSNFKFKDNSFWKTNFKIPFICSQHISKQRFHHKIIHRTLPCNEWLKNIKIIADMKCTYCNFLESDDVIVINYCILFATQFIYLRLRLRLRNLYFTWITYSTC